MRNKGRLFKKLYLQGESSHSIAKKFNLNKNTVLFYLKKVNLQRRSKSVAAKLGVQKGRIPIKKHKISASSQKLTPDKAYVLGVLAGDGWLWYKKKVRTYQVGFEATDRDFAIQFFNSLRNVYKIKPSFKKRKRNVSRWKDLYSIKLCSKEACDDLLKYDSKSFKTKKWRVPFIIKRASPILKSRYLKGFFDSEGSVDLSTKRVVGTSSNIKGLKEIQILLFNLGIKSAINKSTKSFNLKIRDSKSISLFSKKVNFSIKRKANRLKRLTP